MNDVQLTQSEISSAQAKQSTDVGAASTTQQAFASMDPVEELNFLSNMFTLYLQQHTSESL